METAPGVPLTTIGLYLGLGLAGMTALQILLLAVINRYSDIYKEARDAERAIKAAEVAAHLRSEEKKEDWRRQDEVAERVAKAARQAEETALLLLNAQTATIKRTDEVARLAAEADDRIQSQLIEIDDVAHKVHSLVNSDMTAARTTERNQTQLTLIALKRVQALSRNLGILSTPEEDQAIKVAEDRIIELNKILADRLAAQAKIDAATAAAAEVHSVQAKTPTPPLLSTIQATTKKTLEVATEIHDELKKKLDE